MKTRTIAMVIATMMVTTIFTGCGSVKVSTETPKATPIAIPDAPTAEEILANDITLNLTADQGWDADSTPAILHITSKDVEDVEFCHAVTPDAEGGKGSTTVTLAEGKYDVEFISPLNHDGSAYEIYDMGAAQEITVEFGSDMTVDCEMKQIPADQVTDEMIQDIVTKTQAAVEKGDETLKGDAGKATLDKLASNVQNSPNASEETKELANVVKENTDTETKPEETIKTEAPAEKADVADATQGNTNNTVQDNNTAVNNNTQNNTAANNNQNTTQPAAPAQPTAPVQPTQPAQPSAPVVKEEPVHTHTWADHVVTTQEWVANIVTVPDYETTETAVWVCNCGAVMTMPESDAHGMAHILAGEPANGHTETQTTTVQVGSHTEDQGHYETKTSVDYRYCTGCGARQ